VATYTGSAGWGIPRAHRKRFPVHGSQLERYASKLNAVEINSSFYRAHAGATYEKWGAATPEWFRFAIKMPGLISHERRLTRARQPLEKFLDEISGLGRKLGPLLLQLPPSFEFDSRKVGRFFELLRNRHDRAVVCEPRHATWTSDAADRLLKKFEIARVAADPPRAVGLREPGGWRGLVYYRWHGSPRAYFSPYSAETLAGLAAAVRESPSGSDTWCIFDNTGSGAAVGNALELAEMLGC